jgi:hypothetical protein
MKQVFLLCAAAPLVSFIFQNRSSTTRKRLLGNLLWLAESEQYLIRPAANVRIENGLFVTIALDGHVGKDAER